MFLRYVAEFFTENPRLHRNNWVNGFSLQKKSLRDLSFFYKKNFVKCSSLVMDWEFEDFPSLQHRTAIKTSIIISNATFFWETYKN